MRWKLPAVLLALLGVLAVHHPSASSGSEPEAPRPSWPLSMSWLPLESPFPRSALDLQFFLSPVEASIFRDTPDHKLVAVSVEARVAIADRIELGINWQMVANGVVAGPVALSTRGMGPGNLTLKLKA